MCRQTNKQLSQKKMKKNKAIIFLHTGSSLGNKRHLQTNQI